MIAEPANSEEGLAPAAHQFRIRDLLAVMLGLSLILGLGRMLGGSINVYEAILLAAGTASILLAAAFLRHKAVWFAFLPAAFVAGLLLWPGPLLLRAAAGAVVTALCLFAALPVLALGEQLARWPWVAAAISCLVAGAMFTPPDPVDMVALAAPLSWMLAVAAIARRYLRLIALRTPPLA